MDLIDRYLNAVRFWLPKAQRRDIIAELAADIRSQVEDRESALGRPLASADVEALLKERGSPYSVAGRYLPQRQLVGPALFPLYVFVLKIAAAVYLVPWLLVWGALVAFFPAYRAAHSGLAVFDSLGSLWASAVSAFALITAGFAVAEWSKRRSAARREWDPRRLPAVRDALRISRPGSAAEIVVDLLFLAWWAGGLSFPVSVFMKGASSGPGPVPFWADFRAQFFVPVILLIAASAALSAAALVRPYWTRARLAIRAALDLGFAVLALSFLGPRTSEVTRLWASIRAASGSGSPGKWVPWLGLNLVFVLVLVAVICLASAVYNLIRLVRYDVLRERGASL